MAARQIDLLVGDIIRCNGVYATYFYQVEAVCIGAAGRVTLVGIAPLNQLPGSDVNGKIQDVVYVPLPLIQEYTIYRNARQYD